MENVFVKNELYEEYSENCDKREKIPFWQTNVTSWIKSENSGSITNHKNMNLTLKFDNSGENLIYALCQDCNALSGIPEKPCEHIDIFTSWTEKLVSGQLDSINLKDVSTNRCMVSKDEELTSEAQLTCTSDFLEHYVEMSKECGISNLLLKYFDNKAD